MCSTTYVYTHVCGLLRTVCIPFSNLHHSVCNHNRIVGQRQRHPIQSNPNPNETNPRQTDTLYMFAHFRSIERSYHLAVGVSSSFSKSHATKFKIQKFKFTISFVADTYILAHAFGRTKSDLDYCYYSHRCCCCICHSVTKATFLQYIPKLSNNVHWMRIKQASRNKRATSQPSNRPIFNCYVRAFDTFFLRLSLVTRLMCVLVFDIVGNRIVNCVCVYPSGIARCRFFSILENILNSSFFLSIKILWVIFLSLVLWRSRCVAGSI